jgi:ribonuclease Z
VTLKTRFCSPASRSPPICPALHAPRTAFTSQSSSARIPSRRSCSYRGFSTSVPFCFTLEPLGNLADKQRTSNADRASAQHSLRSEPPHEISGRARIRFYDHEANRQSLHPAQAAPLKQPSGNTQKLYRHPLLEPLGGAHAEIGTERVNFEAERVKPRDGSAMSASIEILTTPTADTQGTAFVLRTPTKHYFFGSQAEGTQRALVQQGTRLLKAQDFFLTGRSEWKNTGGFVGMMLTMADSSSSSWEQSMELIRKTREKGKIVSDPPKPHFNIYGPPNLKHTLATCRRFIFRRGIPIHATEYMDRLPQKDENGIIPPNWEDSNIQVWAFAITPSRQQQDPAVEAELAERRRVFDTRLNSFEDHQAVEGETVEERHARYDRIRSATLKYMFDSSWTFDTLVERHISEVQMPAAIFVRNPNNHGYAPYTGPKPGGSEPLPDITVFTRTPWPGANILALPPTKPALESVSYIVRTLPSRGSFDVARAKALGVKPGPDFGKLTSGQSVQNQEGEWITPDQVLGADRPGQGIAILDVPSVDYVQSIARREELVSPQVMSGIGAVVWMLGPGVAGHPTLNKFMSKLSNVQHIISSSDISPNRIAHDSVAGQAIRLGQIDPSRYSVPVYDNTTVPQKNILASAVRQVPLLPKDAIVADRGMNFVLMPKFVFKAETKSPLFDCNVVKEATDGEVLRLAQGAQEAVKNDRQSMHAWKQLLARPDTEVTTLGTGSALPSKYRNVSATLVRVSGVGSYLFDCGENTLGQLSRVFPQEELVDIIKNLRMIWISHLHADHHLGTAGVIRAWYHLKHGDTPCSTPVDASALWNESHEYGLAVISHSGMLQWLNEYSSVEDFGYSRITPIEISPNDVGRGSELNILNTFNVSGSKSTFIPKHRYDKLFGFTDIQAARVAHCHGSMGVSITFPPSPSDPQGVKPLKVSYSGDCRPSQHFAKIGRDTTVLIHEATFDDELQGDAKAKKHSTTSEALGIGAQMNAKAVVLTHFSQRYQKIPVLQTVTDGEQEDPLLDTKVTAEEANGEDDVEVDPTLENADNMDIHPTNNPAPSTTAPAIPTLQHQASSSLRDNERVVKIRNRDMKVAIAFDYMRVKIGEIIELEKFNEALNELLVKEKDGDGNGGEDEGKINENGKKVSGDEKGGNKKKFKQKQQGKEEKVGGQETGKKGKSKRNN